MHVLEEASRLSHLVDSLLTIARAETGQVRLAPTTTSILPFVRETASVLDVLAEEKGQHLSIEGDETVQVQADGPVLRQVLLNLLDNAIKYSSSGARISVRVSRTDHQTAVVDVADSGPGIPPEHREKVFDRFYRIDEGRSREAGGTGLGLAIAKWGAQVHGGQLELECPAAGGCIFRLRLPVADRTSVKSHSETSIDVQAHSAAATDSLQANVGFSSR